MIFWFIWYCLKLGVKPWRFFQLNASYFNRRKGIYSKYDINRLIPLKWRLGQYLDNPGYLPLEFPVFLKPEWGQNSYGIYRADSLSELRSLRKKTVKTQLTYLVQEAALEPREFEIFYIRASEFPEQPAVLSITEVSNSEKKRFPINGVLNVYCSYRDRTAEFSAEMLLKLWEHIGCMGQFRIARVGLKTTSIQKLLEGEFHIVEINLFTPMPLNLLDRSKTWQEKALFIRDAMHHLSRITGQIPVLKRETGIFFKKLMMHYKVKS